MAATTAPRAFELAPLQSMVWPLAILLMVALPVGITLAALFMPQQQPIPASASLALLLVVLVVIATLAMLKRRRITLADGVLVVAATFYTHRAPLATLDVANARIADLDEHTEFRPALKSNGYALPGFQAGHFRLRNRAKAFCLLTNRQRVLILPKQDGGFLLLSPEKPQALLDALRATRG